MSFWTAVFLIVLVIAITEAYKAKTRGPGRIDDRRDDGEALPSRPDPEAQAEIEQLRERIKVLERIAYDANAGSGKNTREISAEIEKLRDKQD